MYNRSKIVFLLAFIILCSLSLFSQSPHGKSMIIDCASCHSPENWSYKAKTASFDHGKDAGYPLYGQHADLECRSCHTSLEFKTTQTSCIYCHTDIHQKTVGIDCARCHSAQSWFVDNITLLHELTSFPLTGVHAILHCDVCHRSESLLRFSSTGVECIDCHRQDYLNAKVPDHVAQQYSLSCATCHSLTGNGWNEGTILHSFFPLEGGHNLSDCIKCHTSGNYSGLNPQCISCHQSDFTAAKDPDHSQFSTQCNNCHSLIPGWRPASFKSHDTSFPIYSGNHKGEWNQCTDCHLTANNYASFSCTDCHEHNNSGNLAKEHDEVGGYAFDGRACYECHPRGD
ncbi:MAG: hypothetical protein IPN29_21665 [Saprospiraceae bacterium]|nr:hypothetical protein [Saprospiraceae bacterium]